MRAGNLLARHDVLHGERGDDVERDAAVVPFAVGGRARDHPCATGDAGLLARLRDPVDVGAERDDRRAAAPFRDPRGGDTGDAAFDLEAVLLEDAREVLRRLDLLHPELAEGEDLIDHLLGHLGLGINGGGEVGLEAVGAGVGFALCGENGGKEDNAGDEAPNGGKHRILGCGVTEGVNRGLLGGCGPVSVTRRTDPG